MSVFSRRARRMFARLMTLVLVAAVLAGVTLPVVVSRAAQQKAKKPAVGELGRYLGHQGLVYHVALAPDEKRFVSCGMDSTVRLWELETGKEINRHTDHTELVKCAAYSPDGQSVLSGGGSTYDLATDTFTRGKDCDLRLWAADSLKEIRRFKGHEDTVWGIVFTPDGKQALSTANDQTIRLWDIASGKEVKRLSDRKNRFSCLALSPEGKQVLAGGGGYQSAALQLWNIEAGKSIRTFQGHKDWVRSVAVSPDGKRGLSGSMDGTVRLWDLETGKQLRSLKHASGIQGVAFSPDGLFAISGSGSQWRATRTRTEPSPGDWLLHVWDLETGKEMAQLAGHRWGLMDVKVCQDGHRVLSAGMDGTIRLWGLPELKPAKKK